MSILNLQSTEMHTGGQAVRIVHTRLPDILGDTIHDKQRYISDKLNHICRVLFHKPRGHENIVGVIIVSPDIPGADLACIFVQKDNFATMCGDAVIATSRYAIDHGMVPKLSGTEIKVCIQCPCGLIDAFVDIQNGRAGKVRYTSVPAFVYAEGIVVHVPEIGQVTVDISYGGAYYAILSADCIGLNAKTSTKDALVRAAGSITDVLRKTVKLFKPNCDEVATLLGTILTDGKDNYSPTETINICVYGDNQVDRSPCGSGTTARVASMFAKNLLRLNQARSFQGPSGSKFVALAIEQTTSGRYKAVIVEVTGEAFYTGSTTFLLEEDDEIGKEYCLQ